MSTYENNNDVNDDDNDTVDFVVNKLQTITEGTCNSICLSTFEIKVFTFLTHQME